MQRRHLIAAFVAVPALGLLAACGSDATGDSLQTSDTTAGTPVESLPATTATPATDPAEAPPEPDATVEAASGDVVLSYTTPGGFTTREFAFQQPPIALLTADGTLIGPAIAVDGAAPPLVQRHQVQTVSPAGVEALLAAAESAGLFADVDYASDDSLLIADAPNSVLTITADGTTYTHEAYALGIGGGPGEGASESTPERQALLDFLMALQSDPASIIGAENLGAPTDYEPTAYQIEARGEGGDLEVDTVIETWPADSGVDLESAQACVEVPRSDVGDLFENAEQFTYFEQDGEIYDVTVRPAYPGSSC